MRLCPLCGARYDDAIRFCVHDGTALDTPPIPAAVPTRDRPVALWTAVVALSLSVVVLLGVLVRTTSARMPPSQTPASTPSGTQESPAPSDVRPPPDPPPVPVGDGTARRVVDRYLAYQSGNDIPLILTLYAPSVRYYDRGWVGHGALHDDKAYYFGRWPVRSNTLDSPIEGVVGPDGVTTLRFQFRFSVAGGSRRRSGRAWAELDLLPVAGGYLIQGERGGVL